MAVPYANRGRAWERWLEESHELLAESGQGVVVKVPTEWLPLRSRTGAIVTAKVTRQAPVDYVGHVRGRPVAFDAKETSTARWPLAHLQPHQAAFLDGWQRAGGVAWVLCHFRAHADVYLLPWSWLRRRWEDWFEARMGVEGITGRVPAGVTLSELRRDHPGWQVPVRGHVVAWWEVLPWVE